VSDRLARELAEDALVEMDESRSCAQAKRALSMAGEAWAHATRGDRGLAFDAERRRRLPRARQQLLARVENVSRAAWKAIDERCGCRRLDPTLNGMRRR
jgi:hypothetical protein